MSDRLRAAIAGVGFIGPVHLRAARLAGAEIVGVSGGDPARTRAAIRGGAAPDGLPTFRDGLRAARIAEAVRVSAGNQTWEEVRS